MDRKSHWILLCLACLISSSCSISPDKIETLSAPRAAVESSPAAAIPTVTIPPSPTRAAPPVPTETAPVCPASPTTREYDNGITWTEVEIPDREYEWSKADLAFLQSCLEFPQFDDHDREIHGERVGLSFSDLRIRIGDDLYETAYDDTDGCCDYDLLKNGEIILQTSAPAIVTDPNQGFWNIDGKLVWELLKDPPTIIVDGEDYNRKFQFDGCYYPYEINGKLIFIARQGPTFQVIYDYQFIGPAFSQVSRAYCCSRISIYRGGGKYLFIGRHDGSKVMVLIQ